MLDNYFDRINNFKRRMNIINSINNAISFFSIFNSYFYRVSMEGKYEYLKKDYFLFQIAKAESGDTNKTFYNVEEVLAKFDNQTKSFVIFANELLKQLNILINEFELFVNSRSQKGFNREIFYIEGFVHS